MAEQEGFAPVIDNSKIGILRCTVCQSDLSQDGDYLECAGCQARFPVIDGIVVMLTKEDVSAFVNEIWGGQLLREFVECFSGFKVASNGDPTEELREICRKSADRGKTTELYKTDIFPEDDDAPSDLNAAIRQSRDEVVRLSGVPTANSILDWPTGSGYCLHYLAKQANPNAIIVSLDINFRGLASIKPYYEKHGLADRMLFVAADARKMPFKDGVFQSVTAWGGICEIENAGAGFCETHRVLEPDGRFGASGDQYKEGSPSMEVAVKTGVSSLVLRKNLESTMTDIGFKDVRYDALWEGLDPWVDEPEEERCPLPARGDWFQTLVVSGQK